MKLIGIALLVGGMALSIGAPFEAREARLLAARGIDTTATVTRVDIQRLSRGSRTAHVDVEFEDEFGLSATGSDVIYCGDADSVAVGDRVVITYDPEEVAPPQFAECPQSQEITIPLVIGVVVMAAGTFVVLRTWRASGWRRRWWGIPILIVGVLFVGTSFEDDCRCRELAYTGGALVLIGTVPLVAPRKPETIELPPEPAAPS